MEISGLVRMYSPVNVTFKFWFINNIFSMTSVQICTMYEWIKFIYLFISISAISQLVLGQKWHLFLKIKV